MQSPSWVKAGGPALLLIVVLLVVICVCMVFSLIFL